MENAVIKKPQIKKIRFDNSGYYLMILVLLVLLGFWPTYFSKYIDGTANFNMYFHFHGLMISLYLIFHYLYLFQISFPLWDSFAKWFALLPIT